MDGWNSILTKLGIRGTDKSVSVRPSTPCLLSYREMAAIYGGDGLGSKIAECVAEDAARNGFKILGDDEEQTLLKRCEDLGLPESLLLAHIYQRAFGGALLIAQYENDSQPLDKPPSPAAKVTGFDVVAAPRVNLSTTQFVTDTKSKYFNAIEIFEITKRYGGSYNLHAARCCVLKGIPVADVPDMEYTVDQLYWGMSAVQRPYDALSNFGAFVQGIGHLGQEMTIGKYRIANLEKMLLTNDAKSIYTRMEIINNSKSTLRAVLLGKDEEYSRDSLTFAGVADVFDRLCMVLSGASKIPVTKLVGRSAAGMNATGEGDSRDYYDLVKAEQLRVVKRPAEWAVAEVDRVTRVTKNHSVEFEPVWTPSQKEELEMRERQQKIDTGYIADGVYTAEIVRDNRFVGGYSFDTKIEASGDVPSPEDKAAYENQVKKATGANG